MLRSVIRTNVDECDASLDECDASVHECYASVHECGASVHERDTSVDAVSLLVHKLHVLFTYCGVYSPKGGIYSCHFVCPAIHTHVSLCD